MPRAVVTQLKIGRTVYARQGKRAEARTELEQRFWAWFETAKTLDQIACRLVVASAAAHCALDECTQGPSSSRGSTGPSLFG